MIVSEGFVLELGHQAVTPEKRLGDHLLIPSSWNLAKEAIQAELSLQHLIQRTLEHDRPRVFWVVDQWLLASSEVDAPCCCEIIQP